MTAASGRPGRGRRLLLTAGGLGLLRPAPGTWGSLPPVIITLALLNWLDADGSLTTSDLWIINLTLASLAALASIACISFGRDAEAFFGRKDPGQVVADEVAGQSIALLGLPWLSLHGSWAMPYDAIYLVTAFIAFRLFDITKPPPARRIQRLPGGWGILIDDLIAGVYAAIAAQIVARGLGVMVVN